MAICKKYLERFAKVNVLLEMELGVTGGEEDGVDNSAVDSSRLYTQPEEVWYTYEELGKVFPPPRPRSPRPAPTPPNRNRRGVWGEQATAPWRRRGLPRARGLPARLVEVERCGCIDGDRVGWCFLRGR